MGKEELQRKIVYSICVILFWAFFAYLIVSNVGDI